MATDIATLGISVDTSDLKRASGELGNIAIVGAKAESQTRRFTGAVGLLNTNLSAVSSGTVSLSQKSKTLADRTSWLSKQFKIQKGAAQQAGFQLQDFAVQMQSGTSFTTAFGQQASQLAGVLGPGGAVIGAIIAVGAAISGPLITALKGAQEETQGLQLDFEDLADRFKEISTIQLRALISETQKQIGTLEKSGAVMRDQVTESEKLNAVLGQITPSFVTQSEGWDSVTDSLVRHRAAQASAGDQMSILKDQLKEYEDQLNSLLGLSTDSGQVAFTATFPTQEQMNQRRYSLQGEMDALAEYDAEVQARTLTAYQEYQQARAEIDSEAAQEQRDKLISAYQEYAQARVATDEIADQRSRKIAAQNAAARLQTETNLQSAFMSLMNSQSRELFELGKVGAASSAIVNAYEAASKALTLGPILGPIAAGTIFAAGLSNAYNIMSRKFGDTSAAASPSSTASANASTNTSTTTNTQNISNTFNVSGSNAASLVEQIQAAFDSGAIAIQNGSVVSV